MADLAPGFVHPVLNEKMEDLLNLLPENGQALKPVRS